MKSKYKKKKNFFQRHKNIFSTKNLLTFFIALIMVLSILGMALMYNTGNNSNKEHYDSKNLPLTYLREYNVWLAIVNGQKFVFNSSIAQDYLKYNFSDQLLNLIHTKNVYVYFDKNFDPSSQFLLYTFFTSLNENMYSLNKSVCSNGVVLFLTNESLYNSLNGNCIKLKYFNMTSAQMYHKTNALIFFLLRNMDES